MPKIAVNHWAAVGLALFAAVGSVGGLAWYAHRPDIPFLARHHPAEWIVYPQPNWYIGHRAAPLDSRFRRSFHVEKLPRHARLEVRLFRHGKVQINGQTVLEVDSRASVPAWKASHRRDVASALRLGENELQVSVVNDSAPPALWFALEFDQTLITSDSQWRSSYAGAVWQPARSANRQVVAVNLGQPLPRLGQSLRSRIHALVRLVGLGIALWSIVEVWLSRRGASDLRPGDRVGLSNRESAVLLIAVGLVWATMVLHNRPWVASGTGFDAFWHKQYINYLQHEHKLPQAYEGAEMHQPPLYYLLGAIVLSVVGQEATSYAGVSWLRGLSGTLGMAHLVFIFLGLRIVFPDRPRRQIAGLVLAACLPMHLFIFQYVTNETLMTTLASASVYLTLRLLMQPRPSVGLSLLLGGCLGAALLTKLTAVIVVAAVLLTLGGRLVVIRKAARLRGLQTVALIALSCVAVGGWHYARMYRNYGTPFPRQVEDLGSKKFWVAPGYHTWAHLTHFGDVLRQPYFTGLQSFPDAIYSTCFGDGRFGGSGRREVRPPWNYGLMTVGYLLALVPMAAIVVGAILAVVTWIRHPESQWGLLLSLLLLMIMALVYENLKHPQLTVAKAWYALPAMAAVCALAAWGIDPWPRGRWWWRGLTFPAFFTWALCSLATFWVEAGTPRAYLAVAAKHIQRKRFSQALRPVRRVIASDPRNAQAYQALGSVLQGIGRKPQAVEAFTTAVTLAPGNSSFRYSLAAALHVVGRDREAARQLDETIKLAPGLVDAYVLRSLILKNQGRVAEALKFCIEALRLNPHQIELHAIAGNAYLADGQTRQARRYARYALAIDPAYTPAHELLARIASAEGDQREALQHYRQALALSPNRNELLDAIAWILATSPDRTIRNAASAVALSRQACKNSGHREAPFLRTNAAALAAAGRFDEAEKTAREAARMAILAGLDSLADELNNDLTRYRDHRALTVKPETSGPPKSP